MSSLMRTQDQEGHNDLPHTYYMGPLAHMGERGALKNNFPWMELVSAKEERINLHHRIDLAPRAQWPASPNVHDHGHNSCAWGSTYCQWGKNEWCKPRFQQKEKAPTYIIQTWFWPEAGQEFAALAFSKLIWQWKTSTSTLTCIGNPTFFRPITSPIIQWHL